MKSTTPPKKIAPSGTALSLREVISKNNPKVEISSARGGDVIGNHEVSFFGKNEIIRLSHLAENRNAFAEGICKAADICAVANLDFMTCRIL